MPIIRNIYFTRMRNHLIFIFQKWGTDQVNEYINLMLVLDITDTVN